MAMVPRDVAINRPVFELTPKSQPKYPHAQMEPAVERCLGHGRCLSAPIKALCHPARDSLRV